VKVEFTGLKDDACTCSRGCNKGLRRWLVTKTILRFICDETGATAIEYGLIAAGISIAIIATVAGVGSSLNTTFTSVQTALK
jgi:pilus assembly protein Flp/PilA